MKHTSVLAVALVLLASCAETGEVDDGIQPCPTCASTGATSSASSAATTATAATSGAATQAASATATSSSTGVMPMSFTLDDALDASTVGHTVGGELTDEGWRVTARTDRVWFEIPRLVEGSIAFTVTGMSNTVSPNMPLNDHEIFTMYEAGYGITEPIRYAPEYRNNYFKAMIRVYGEEPGREGQQKLLWVNCAGGAPGYSEDAVCPCADGFLDEPFDGEGTWDGSPVRMRVEWRQHEGARLFKDDAEVVSVAWTDATGFGPNMLHFTIGSARADAVDTAGMPIGAIFSDLHVEGVTGDEITCAP